MVPMQTEVATCTDTTRSNNFSTQIPHRRTSVVRSSGAHLGAMGVMVVCQSKEVENTDNYTKLRRDEQRYEALMEVTNGSNTMNSEATFFNASGAQFQNINEQRTCLRITNCIK